MINPIHLRTLTEVVRLGSLASAANRLGYTPSAVSQQMSALEADSGVKLFDRTARSIRPTEAAHVMSQRGAMLLAELDEMINAAVDAGAETKGELRVSIFSSLAHRLLPELMQAQLSDEPDLNVRLSVRDPTPAIQALRGGEETDVTLVYRVGESGLSWPSSVSPVYLGEDKLRFVVPKHWKLHGKGPVKAKQLIGKPWILHFMGTSDFEEIESMFAAHELRPRVVARSDDYVVDLKLVESGYAGSIIPEVMLKEVPNGVQVLDVPEVSLSRSVWALISERSSKPPVERFLRRVSDMLAKHIGD